MRLVSPWLLLILVAFSCKEIKDENITTEKDIVNSKEITEQKLNAYCFFKLDDKYSIENNSLIINNWLKLKSEILLKHDTIPNIFDQNGGGPKGSQWNPATDLYIAILKHSKESTELPKLTTNGKLYNGLTYIYNPSVIWYKVEEEYWNSEIKAIEEEDFDKMYQEGYLSNIEKKQFNPDTFGKVLKFEISFEEEVITKYFQAAFGE